MSNLKEGDFPYQLITNPTLEEIIGQIQNTEVGWNDLISRSLQAYSFYLPRGNNNLTGTIGELILSEALKEIASKNERVQLNPIPSATISGGFIFSPSSIPGGMMVFQDTGPKIRSYCEYDALISVEDLPIIFEIKMTTSQNSDTGLGRALDIDKIARKLLPLERYFASRDFGYVVVAPRNAIQDRHPRHIEFKDMGGSFLPLSIKLKNYRAAVRKAQEQSTIIYGRPMSTASRANGVIVL